MPGASATQGKAMILGSNVTVKRKTGILASCVLRVGFNMDVSSMKLGEICAPFWDCEKGGFEFLLNARRQ